ncbi:hypothetical protein EC9_38500 [Rosistilla ulvae]|uniref:PEP-CTERM protein-sorting domain-containing protein n=1 Tax=Rosistilla ulvae TaxID=1930277 RepID=A0A517M439_9BACT|nr:PEP-CTERM sorting domain-containing protein [Rosistilla ulvae]QDS89650.1 hypothetical protein EC9_38500 [Rosistilla ulvae]
MKPLLLSIAILTLQSSAALCDIIAHYNFNDSSRNSTDTNALTIASSITSQATGPHSGSFGFMSTPAGAVSPALVWSAIGEREPSTTYFEFDIDLAVGTSAVSFESLHFDAFVADTLGNTTAFDYNLYWSTDGFSTTIGSGAGPSISGTGAQNTTSPLNFDLSGLAPQSSTVTFRLDPVFASGSSENGAGSQRRGAIDNVTLNGTATAAVPEPSTLILCSLAGVFGIFRRSSRTTGPSSRRGSCGKPALSEC